MLNQKAFGNDRKRPSSHQGRRNDQPSTWNRTPGQRDHHQQQRRGHQAERYYYDNDPPGHYQGPPVFSARRPAPNYIFRGDPGPFGDSAQWSGRQSWNGGRGAGNQNAGPASAQAQRAASSGGQEGSRRDTQQQKSRAMVDQRQEKLSEYEEKLLQLVPDRPTFDGLPEEARTEPPRFVLERRIESAKAVVERIEEEVPNETTDKSDASDSEDSDFDMCLGAGAEQNFPKKRLKAFVEALPGNVLFTIGFDVWGIWPKDTESCWCPCSTKKMANWRTKYNLGDAPPCDSRVFTPNALTDHLDTIARSSRDKWSGLYHRYVLEYLKLVYRNEDSKRGLPSLHKAFYKPQSQEHARIDAHEKRELLQKIKELKLERAEHEEKIAAQAVREKIDRYRSEEQEKCVELIDRIFSNTGKAQGASVASFDHGVLVDSFKAFLDTFRGVVPEPKVNNPLFTVPQGFDISSEVYKWQKSKHPLFGDLSDMKVLSQLVHESTVQFEAEGGILGGDDAKPKDEGGPKREFLAHFWKNLPSLKARISEFGAEYPLFEQSSAGCVPSTDEQLKTYQKEKSETLFKNETGRVLRRYYKAIGRLMAHAILTGSAVPMSVLAPLFRCVCVRGTKPMDPGYPSRELVRHIIAFLNRHTVNYVIEEENIKDSSKFAKSFQGKLTDSRSVAIQGLQEGLSLDGMFGLHAFFAIHSLDTIDSLAFAKPKFSAEEMIELIQPEKIELTCHQVNLIDNLKDILREEGILDEYQQKVPEDSNETKSSCKREEFLPRFLQYVTGQDFIPPNKKNFKIGISFDVFESNHPDMLPITHTCVPCITFPESAYAGKKAVLRAKLLKAQEYCHGDAAYNMQ